MLLSLATSMTKGKTTPQLTAALAAFNRSTPDPTVYYVPVIWILVLADSVEKKQSKGRKVEEEGICSLCCKMASMQLKSDVMREAEEHSFTRSILINIAAEEYTFGSN